MRDYAYIAQRERENDLLWSNYEKWLYYDKTNENYAIPTGLLCVIAFFTYPPGMNIMWCIIVIAGALALCKYKNRKLDMNPYIQKRRYEVRWIYRCAESACPVFWKSHIRLSEITLNQLNYPLFYETWLVKALPPLAVLAALINQGT